MKRTALIVFTLLSVISASAQDVRRQIYDTERAFEKMAAEKGVSAAFVEFLSPTGVMFLPDLVNGRDAWRERAGSPAFLTWNPIWIDVSSNGALAYSIGNSQYRSKGKDDTTVYYGHYISVWMRQSDGRFLAVFDTGISHEKPASEPTEWKSPPDSGKENNPDKISAADSAVGFYQMAAQSGAEKAYRSYLADDVIFMREGKLPAFGRKGAISMLDGQNRIAFAKRKSFIEAVDLAYVHSPYTISDEKGVEIERGNFVQVWKLRGKKWFIVADLFKPLPANAN